MFLHLSTILQLSDVSGDKGRCRNAAKTRQESSSGRPDTLPTSSKNCWTHFRQRNPKIRQSQAESAARLPPRRYVSSADSTLVLRMGGAERCSNGTFRLEADLPRYSGARVGSSAVTAELALTLTHTGSLCHRLTSARVQPLTCSSEFLPFRFPTPIAELRQLLLVIKHKLSTIIYSVQISA
ncbi:hypothetical protein J6590_009482 [Homalodisca vitripennis]|nr:hypothetical protein J6590_009482 [Homalodisca vitripennis]